MLPEEEFASPAPGARQSLRDLQGHLQHLQSLYDDVQAQVVAQTPAGSTRRRATDPGSPSAPPSSGSWLRRSTVASPLRQPLLTDIAEEGGASGRSSPMLRQGGLSPTRALATERLHALRRSRSSLVTAIASAAAAAVGHTQAEQAVEPVGSYQQFAAQVFEERFCPLRVGMQHTQQPQQQQEQQVPQLGQQAQQQAAPQAWQTAQQPQLMQRPQPEPEQQQPAQQQLQQLQEQAAANQSRQPPQQPPGGTLQQPPRSSLLGATLAGGVGAADPATPLDRQRLGGGQAGASSVAASSSGGSVLSYASEEFASEEGDAVLLASPAKGGELSLAAPPAAGSMPGPAAPAAPPAAAPARNPSTSAEERYAASPLPLLETALQLLSGPAEPQCVAHAAAVATAPSTSVGAVNQQEPAQAALASASLAAAAAAAADVSGIAAFVPLRPQRLEFDNPSSYGPAAGSVQAAAGDARQPQQQQAALQDVLPAAHSTCVAAGEQSAPSNAQSSEGAAAAAEQSQPQPGARSRVQALLRLKQRRLQQHPASSSTASAECHLQQSTGTAAEEAVGASSAVAAAGCSPLHSPADKTAREQRRPATCDRTVQEEGGSVTQPRWSPRRAPPQAAAVSPRHRRQLEEQEQQGQQEEQDARQPKPFLRRRTERVAVQRLPDWKSVRSRTSSRWEGADESSGDGSSRPSTPGAGVSAGSTPTGCRATTPRVPGPSPHVAQQQQRQQQRPPTGSRLADVGGGVRTGSRLGAGTASAPLGGWGQEGEEAAYTLERPAVARVGSRGRNADVAAGRAAVQPGAQPQRQRTPHWGTPPRQLSPRPPSRQPQHGSARNTPFAPRPNSHAGGHHDGGGHKGRWQQLPQPAALRPRGTPLYDASSLMPLDPDNLQLDHLLHGGGSSAGPEEVHYAGMFHGAADGGGMYFGGGDGGMHFGGGEGGGMYSGGGDGGGMLHGGGGSSSSRRPLTGGSSSRRPPTGSSSGRRPPTGGSSGRSACGDGGMVAGGAAGDIGPLDDLLSQVDRMLHQVERAIS